MANLTAWAGGALDSGSVAYQAAFNASDLNSLPNGDCVLSSVTAFDNTTGLDQFLDISFVGTISSSTIAAGAAISFWIAYLQEDGTTYGDGRLTAGTQTSYTPLLSPVGAIPFQTGSSITKLVGDLGLITLRPRGFALILQNNSGFTLASSGNSCSISTYRQNTNS